MRIERKRFPTGLKALGRFVGTSSFSTDTLALWMAMGEGEREREEDVENVS